MFCTIATYALVAIACGPAAPIAAFLAAKGVNKAAKKYVEGATREHRQALREEAKKKAMAGKNGQQQDQFVQAEATLQPTLPHLTQPQSQQPNSQFNMAA